MTCPSCSLRVCRSLPLLLQRAAAVCSSSYGGSPSTQPQRLLAPIESKQDEVGAVGIRKFVENITKKPKEARLWLKYFKVFSATSPGKAFAVMQLAPDVFSDFKSVRRLAWSAAFLFENNLMSLIVCQLANDADWRNVESLRALLAKHGVPSEVVVGSENTPDQLLTLGHTHLPIVCCPVLEPAHDSVQDTMLRLCSALRPLKVLMLSQQAGLKDADGKAMSDVLLPADFDALVGGGTHLSAEEQKKIVNSAELVRHLSCESSVVLTSPDTVVQELFTHHGSGTMIRLSEKILRHSNLQSVNTAQLRALINESFHKKLDDVYFERIADLVETVYISEHCNAAAIVLRLPNVSVPYLDKIAVSEAAQGNGIAVLLWNQITKDYQRLFWRSRITNRTATAWYNTLSQGSWKTDQSWTIFWYGLKYSHHLTELIEYAEGKAPDFLNG